MMWRMFAFMVLKLSKRLKNVSHLISSYLDLFNRSNYTINCEGKNNALCIFIKNKSFLFPF